MLMSDSHSGVRKSAGRRVDRAYFKDGVSFSVSSSGCSSGRSARLLLIGGRTEHDQIGPVTVGREVHVGSDEVSVAGSYLDFERRDIRVDHVDPFIVASSDYRVVRFFGSPSIYGRALVRQVLRGHVAIVREPLLQHLKNRDTSTLTNVLGKVRDRMHSAPPRSAAPS
jgi:hypothetical protein